MTRARPQSVVHGPPIDAPDSVSAQITVAGDLSGLAAVGNNIVQMHIGELGNLVVPAAGPPRVQRRPPPVLALGRRPRRFLDRESETAAGLAGARAGDVVEFFGPHGAGKSALLRELAHRLADDARRGDRSAVVLVDASSRPLEDALQELFGLLHEADRPYLPTGGELRRHLQDCTAFVLVDDVDVEDSDVHRLLDVLPDCGLLLTASRPHDLGGVQSLALSRLPQDDALALVTRSDGLRIPVDERVVEQLVERLGGRPGDLMELAVAAAHGGSSLESVAEAADPRSAALEALPGPAHRVLRVLAAVPGLALSADDVSALIDDPAHDHLDAMLEQGLFDVVDEDGTTRFRMRPSLGKLMRAQWGLETEKQRLTALFRGRLQPGPAHASPTRQQADAVRLVLLAAAQQGRWLDVLQLGRGVQAALALSGSWGSWCQVLSAMLVAARGLQDAAGEAFALHQLGTRALCLGQFEEARSLLTEALRLREALGDTAGSEITAHNLQLLSPVLGVTKEHRSSGRSSPPLLQPSRRSLAGVLLGAVLLLVLAAVISLASSDPQAVTVDVGELSFGEHQVGTSSSAQPVTVTNHGTDATTLEVVRLAGAAASHFAVDTGTCAQSLAVDASCVLQVMFLPTSSGPKEARLEIGPSLVAMQTVSLTGTGMSEQLGEQWQATPAALDFGAQRLQATAERSVRLTSRERPGGPLDEMRITGVHARDFRVTRNDCGQLLPRGRSCEVFVAFKPSAEGDREAQLDLPGQGERAAAVPLRGEGTGLAGTATVTPAVLDFGRVEVGTTGGPRGVTVANTGTAPLLLGTATVRGRHRAEFAVDGRQCPASLPGGGRCVLQVRHMPTATGPRTATLAAGDGTITVPVRGAAVPPAGDVTGPIIDAADQVVEATSRDGADVELDVSARDAVDGVVSVACDPPSGRFPLGTTEVTCTAVDRSGNRAEPSRFRVTVRDTTPPTLDLPRPDPVEAASLRGATVRYEPARATDVVDGTVDVRCSDEPGSVFALRTTTVTCTADDRAGNTGSGQFDVEVRDTTPPQIDKPRVSRVVAVLPPGANEVPVAYDEPAATDLGQPAAVTCVPPPRSAFAVGDTLVSCTADDGRGNTSGPVSFSVVVVPTPQ